ncbi:WxcM-like domain-containing protein [Candidatus Nitrosotenuis chungbukensis]|uniref:WxcM-like domain-containing protein n=1 Tax=Candidatus Nitrosotenuis chungbukensis TaxID=1353246 RepID=UPI0005B2A5BE|nr:WxcM-like domain-containing protein [Candidatus Nitrosotenuis chungbukensis]WKT58307.1 WxcM-like domain-containing protein [Candidatus Nitrosotenuis chungbukensis]
MQNNTVKSIKLEKHDTKDTRDGHVNGSLTVIWRDWDNIIESDPKMVYASSVNPGEIKGPHLHTKRNSFFVCIRGKVVFVVKCEDGSYQEIESSEDSPILVTIPKGTPSAHININDKKSIVLALADIAWRPNDNEMINVEFNDYNWKKWSEK